MRDFQPTRPTTNRNQSKTNSDAAQLSRFAEEQNLRLASVYSFGQVMPSVTIDPTEYNEKVELKGYIKKLGFSYDSRILPVAFMRDFLPVLGLQADMNIITSLLVASGVDLSRKIMVSALLTKIIKLPISVQTTKVKTSADARRNKKNLRSDNKNRTHTRMMVSKADIKLAVVNWFSQRFAAFCPANTVRQTIFVYDPSVTTDVEAKATRPIATIHCIFAGDDLIVDTVCLDRYIDLDNPSEMILHDVQTADHAAPYTQKLHQLLLNGRISLREIGVQDPASFVRNAFRKGSEWAYRNLLAEIVKVNSAANKTIKAKAEKLVVEAEKNATDKTKMDTLVKAGSTVYDNVRSARNPELVASATAKSRQQDQFNLGLPASFGYGQTDFGQQTR